MSTEPRRAHNLIALNVAASLHGQLKGRPCETYAGDMRVHTPASELRLAEVYDRVSDLLPQREPAPALAAG
jgi:hypothetical protein